MPVTGIVDGYGIAGTSSLIWIAVALEKVAANADEASERLATVAVARTQKRVETFIPPNFGVAHQF